jgi:hypothetical protein
VVKDMAATYNGYLKNGSNYYSRNPMSGGIYYVEQSVISKYYKAANVDSVYAHISSSLFNYRDSLLKTNTIMIAGKPAREYISLNRHNGQQNRSRLLVVGNEMFYMGDRLVKDELFDDATNTFLNSLVISKTPQAFDLSASKAELITSDLQSKDSTTYNYALGAFSYYKFTPAELPTLYTALQKSYADDTSRYGARGQMIDVLKETHDDQSAAQLLKLYPTLQKNDELKAEIMNVLPVVDTKNGLDAYLKLLLTDKPLKLENNYRAFYPLNDTLDYAAAHFQQILPLINSPTYQSAVLSLCAKMAAKSLPVYNKLLRDNFNVITKGRLPR